MIDLSPQVGAGMPERRAGRVAQPNPFLLGFKKSDGTVDETGTLMDSFNNGTDFVLTVPGEWVDDVVKRGERAGEPLLRLIGPAAQVEHMIRSAADSLGLGVSIAIDASPNKRGHVVIRYQAKTRRAYGKKNENA